MRGFQRPKATVLPDAAVVPAANLVQPPPKRFTHAVPQAQPYFYALPTDQAQPDGQFDAGAQVLLKEALPGDWCQVIDGRGLRVVTAHSTLVPLPAARD